MTGLLRIAPMTFADFEVAIEWAASEGWNPGLDDAAAMYGVDTGGFLMGWVDDQRATAISVVRHSDMFGFLGFYLCHPDFRGQGFGWQTWQAGMARLGNRVVGLDGVPAQQSNYEKSGYILAHQTERFGGKIHGQSHAAYNPATPTDLDELIALDRRLNGVDRQAYLTAWFTETEHRKSLVGRSDRQIISFGTIRACREGHKIGPLVAPDGQAAQKMMQALAHAAGATTIYIDVPVPNTATGRLMGDLELQSEFSCARMYRGSAAGRDLEQIFGEVSFELG